MTTDARWERIREDLRFGQVFAGAVVKVPRPGAIGIFVDIGLSVGGFVDVVLLPEEAKDWPAEGTVTDFELWWADDRRQIRLKPSDARYLRSDFADFVQRFRPGWPSDIGRPVHDPESAPCESRVGFTSAGPTAGCPGTGEVTDGPGGS
ncbi:hypothetical protein DKG34_35155 [Streptomyces sp. NWU49]|uniref:hypothetical protein n=1 Tax=Streptomyces sp. NWU49 TaxID=2201153 RepID=UPI000D682823|nr:hypothetical protein [Streptomyces sp. NWU49]PWJ03097.1 hypothetical protein DKG34_35155 [Streptomyces sp. NWU49]